MYRATLENCFHKDRRRNVGYMHHRGRQICLRITKKTNKTKKRKKKRGHNLQKWPLPHFFLMESFRDHGPKSDAGGNRPKLPDKNQ